MDTPKLEAFVNRILDDLGAASSVPLVRIGDRLGLYKALAERPMTAAELADATGCAERYVREWCAQQAASRYVDYDAASGRFTLPPEHTMVFADADSPVFMMGAFDLIAASAGDTDTIARAFRTGEGVGYGARDGCLFCAMARFFRTGYRAELLQDWLPALSGVVERLREGARVADVGCGHGLTTVIMAEAFPRSQFIGFDFHPGSVAAAERHAREHGVTNASFAVATAKGFEGRFDVVAMFDMLHDLGDPLGAVRHARSALAGDGVLMVVEPAAGDRLEDNLNPVGRLYYAGSTMICVPASLAQETGAALGAQAGTARLTAILNEGGFSRVRRAAATPFNQVLEARP